MADTPSVDELTIRPGHPPRTTTKLQAGARTPHHARHARRLTRTTPDPPDPYHARPAPRPTRTTPSAPCPRRTSPPPRKCRDRHRPATAAARRRRRCARGRAGPRAHQARVDGLDVARALAIVGMFAVHVGPLDDASVGGRLYALAHGRASLLFVLVAGVGISLLASRRRDRPRHARLTLLWRAALLLPAGLALQTLDHGVNVILQGYALLFLVAALVLALPDRWLLAAAGAAATLGPAVFLWGRLQDPVRFRREAIELGDAPLSVLDGLVLSGPYPLITWAAPLLLGMWIGRRDLRDTRLHVALLGVGGALAIGALALAHLGEQAGRAASAGSAPLQALLDAAPHSQMPLWLLGGTGSAMLVLGASLALTPRLGRATALPVALGQLALTAYVAHLLALHVAGDALRPGALAPSVAVVVGGSTTLALAAWMWHRQLGRGPLERLMRLPALVTVRSSDRLAAPDARHADTVAAGTDDRSPRSLDAPPTSTASRTLDHEPRTT